MSPSHPAKECASKIVCRHCNGQHQILLHDPDKQKKRSETANLTDVEPAVRTVEQKMKSKVDTPTYNLGFPAKTRNQLQVILVTIFGENKEKLECYAILDNSSIISYVLDTIAYGINAPKAI